MKEKERERERKRESERERYREREKERERGRQRGRERHDTFCLQTLIFRRKCMQKNPNKAHCFKTFSYYAFKAVEATLEF